MIAFANPEWLWLLNVIPLMVAWHFFARRKQEAALLLPAAGTFPARPVSIKSQLRHSLLLLRIICMASLMVAMARPQAVLTKNMIASEGIDIMLAFDISGSMLTRDFEPNRLEAAKKVAVDFIRGRPNDRIGVVFFAGEAYTGAPVTIDHDGLQKIITGVTTGSVEDGTAIGMGLGMAAQRLMGRAAGKKVIILVTDGENNAGIIKPLEAAQLVKSEQINLYCIGIFSPAAAQQPGSAGDSMFASIGGATAEQTLLQIAEITGGQYFRAGNTEKLASIYDEIDALEKTEVAVTSYKRYEEKFAWLAIIAALALLLEMILRYTAFRTIP